MSWYLATKDSVIDQFASGGGLASLRAASDKSPTLIEFFQDGFSDQIPKCIEGLREITASAPSDVASTAEGLARMMAGHAEVFITQGFGVESGAAEKLSKTLETFRIDTADDAGLGMIRSTFQQHIDSFFAQQREGIKQRVGLVAARMKKVDDPKPTQDEIDAIEEAANDFHWFELVYPAETAIYDAGMEGANKGLIQAGVRETAAIGKSQDLARAYAQDRAAEMVGMKWVDGELVPNPDARWAISDTTRDAIREAVDKAFAGETPIEDLGSTIADSGAFSGSRAAMIAKTEVTRAQSKGILGSWLQTGAVLKAKWVLSSLHHCCDDCDLNAAAGAVEVGKAYPSGDTEPGAHPNCNCALIAVEIRKAI